MPQTIILKGHQHAFAGGIIPGNVTATTTNPATGNVTYNLAAQGPVVVPFAGNQVHSFVLPVNGNTLTIFNNSTSGLSCVY